MVKNFICCGLSVDICLHGNEGPNLPQKFSLFLRDVSLCPIGVAVAPLVYGCSSRSLRQAFRELILAYVLGIC